MPPSPSSGADSPAPVPTIPVCGLPVAVIDYRGAVERIIGWALAGDAPYAVEAANTHVAALSRHDAEFGAAMARFDLVCPDGMPLVWAVNHELPRARRLGDRVYGPTLMLRTIEATERVPAVRHFFLGGSAATLRKLEARFAARNPGAVIAGSHSPPFGEWPPDEFDHICRAIREARANVIWVGLGCPKQEKWIGRHKADLPPGVYLGIGAAFAFHAGEVSQAPMFLQRRGLEWLYRLLMEPRRLFKRYLIHNTLFVRYWVADARRARRTRARGATPATRPAPAAPSGRPARRAAVDPAARCNVLGVGISPLTMDSAVERALAAADRPGFHGYVTVTGVHGVVESQRDPRLRRIHNRSYMTTPDGMPMVWLAHWNGFDEVGRVYGPDLMLEIFRHTDGTDHRHYLFGSREGVAARLADALRLQFPHTTIVGAVTPPFRALTGDEERELVDELRRKRPHFFWVGLSTPKQERFMHDFLGRHPGLTAGWPHGFLMLGVGAAFDFHTGLVPQAPRWMQRRGLEWFFRLCMEPRRLWKRYLFNNTTFLRLIIPQMQGRKNYPLEK